MNASKSNKPSFYTTNNTPKSNNPINKLKDLEGPASSYLRNFS